MNRSEICRLAAGKSAAFAALVSALVLWCCPPVIGDGGVFAPKFYKERAYAGSVEETSQEAIIIFHTGEDGRSAIEDLILKVSVKGEVMTFG